MLTKNPQSASKIVSQIVSEIQNENLNCRLQKRSTIREKIVIPVLVCDEFGNEVSGFTRDLSVTGVCLITNREFHVADHWTIDLYRLDGNSNAILSKCRWTQSFGDSFWLSGWQFPPFE